MTAQDQSHLAPPILIIGYMHSGTTLLQQILGRHQDIFISGGETRFFGSLPATKRHYPNLEDDQTLVAYIEYLLKVICTGFAQVNFTNDVGYKPVNLADFGISQADVQELFRIVQNSRNYTRLYSITFDFLAKKQNKKRWLDKLPGYVSQLDRMTAVVPDAQVIELVRDPRDILASKKRRAAKGGSYDPIWDSLAWKTSVRAGAAAARTSPSHMIRIRYEDLVGAPELTVQTICQFLNLQYDPQMLSVGWINSTTMAEQEPGSQIGTDAVGKWRRILPPSHAAACQQLTHGELAVNQYEIDPIPLLTYLALPVLLIRSGAEFFTRFYHKWRRGGMDLVRSVFANYRIRLMKLIRS